jgi:ABC-type multidrug transport system permease subunit
MNRWRSFRQLLLARFREFYREPIAIFWVYGFPFLLAVGLALAFRTTEAPPPDIDIQEEPAQTDSVHKLQAALEKDGLPAELHSAADCHQRLRTGKTALYVVPVADGYRYEYDPARGDSVLARYRVDNVVLRLRADVVEHETTGDTPDTAIQHWKAGSVSWETTEVRNREPGNRYIDFLMPGLIGLNIMGGGLFGIGFALVDMRVRKLLKRLLATPMSRSDFLLSIFGSRLVFMLPEMLFLGGLAWLVFGVPMQGNWLTLIIVIVVGSAAFSGLGLLIASRTDKLETASGLMNLVMLPGWLVSGTFFSAKHFPAVAQPVIQALPLTQVNDALRAVMLEGASLAAISWRLAILLGWAGVSFLLALRWFRWN